MKLNAPSYCAALQVERDLASGAFVVATPAGAKLRLREWSWGERARLIAACTVEGQFDRARFVDAFVELLFAPSPPDEERELLACVALELLGVSEEGSRTPLAARELAFAQRLGWSPAQLDAQGAPGLDRIWAQLARTPPTQRADGWNTIEVVSDERPVA